MKKICLLLAILVTYATDGIHSLPTRLQRTTPNEATYLQIDNHAHYDVGLAASALRKPDELSDGDILLIITNSTTRYNLHFPTAKSGGYTNRLASLSTSTEIRNELSELKEQTDRQFTNFFIYLVGYGTNNTIHSFAADLDNVKIRIKSNHP